MYSFDEILGNNEVKDRLRAFVRTGKASHAYILSGGRGTGKKLLAGAFAKALQCLDRDREPCGGSVPNGGFEPCEGSVPCEGCEPSGGSVPCGCVSCRVFDAGNHPDVFYVRPKKTRAIGVDDIREQVVAEIATKPYRYRYKIFIIDESDKMTHAAQNALLKTLEEPPEYGMFLLIAANPEALLPTVRSRAVGIKTKELPAEEIAKSLSERLGIPPGEAAFYAEYSRGSMGAALSMAGSEDFRRMRDDALSVLGAIETSDITSVMGLAKVLEVYKVKPEFLDIFDIWYRDLLMIKSLGDTGRVMEKDRERELLAAARRETVPGIVKKIEAVSRARDALSANANFVLAMELMLIKLKENT